MNISVYYPVVKYDHKKCKVCDTELRENDDGAWIIPWKLVVHDHGGIAKKVQRVQVRYTQDVQAMLTMQGSESISYGCNLHEA